MAGRAVAHPESARSRPLARAARRGLRASPPDARANRRSQPLAREPRRRWSRKVQMRDVARRPHARRSLSTLSVRSRATTKQLGLYRPPALVFAGGGTVGGSLRPLDGSVADGLEQLEGNLEEVLHRVGIEVRPRAAGDLLAGRLEGDGHRVGPVESHGVEGVRHCEDPRPEWDHLAAQPERIPGAVPALVVVIHDGHGAPEKGDALDEAAPEVRVGAHDLPLVGREGPGLEEDAVRDADLADVVKEHAVLDVTELAVGQSVGAGKGQGVADHAPGVSVGAHVTRVESGAERLQGRAIRVLELVQGRREVAGGFPHASLEHRVVFAALHEELPALQRALGGDEDRLHVDGLGDEIVCPALEALDGRLDVAHARDDDDGGVAVEGAGPPEEVEAVHDVHLDVGQRQGRALPLEGLETLATVARHPALVAVGEEDFPEGGPHHGIVLHDEHFLAHGRRAHSPLPSDTAWTTPISSCTETRFLPDRLAAYRASSAAWMSSSAVGATSSGREAMPKLAVTRRLWAN